MSTKKAVTIPIGYGVMSLQQAHNAGLNGFAVDLLAESYGDDRETKFPEGGIIFCYPHDHHKRPIWVVITHEAPMIIDIDEKVVEPT